MIQAKELRIGNYIKAVGLDYLRVDEISLTNHQGYIARMYPLLGINQYVWCDLSLKEAQPIPLTPELLEKCCGFKKATEYIYDHKSGIIFDAPNDWNNPNNYPIGIDCSRSLYGFNPEQIIIRTLTLHDLQNKFYSITGEELEIDLTALQ